MKIFGLLLLLTFLVGGCRFFKGNPYQNTTISGSTRIAVDETLRPVLEAEIELFKGIYGYSDIKAAYLPEEKTFAMLIHDSVQLIVAARMLRSDEIARLKERKLFPRQLKIATDAIALIVHSSNKDSILTMKEVREILEGKISKWNQLDPSLPDRAIRVLFDNQESGIVRFLADSICDGHLSIANLSALDHNLDVIEYTATHPDVLGFIGGSWISNKNDSVHSTFYKKIKTLSISNSDKSNSSNSYKPYQAFLLEGRYPLTRSIYLINSEPRNGLSTGFASFLAGEKGQRLILKTGILPAEVPSRVVNVRPNL